MPGRGFATMSLIYLAMAAFVPAFADSTPAQIETCDQKRNAWREVLTSAASFGFLRKKTAELIKSITPEEEQALGQLVTLRRGASVSDQALKDSYESIVSIYRKVIERAGLKFKNPISDAVPGMSLWFGVSSSADHREELPAIDARLIDANSLQKQNSPSDPNSFVGMGLLGTTGLGRLPIRVILSDRVVLLSQYADIQLSSECAGVTSNLNPLEFNSIPLD